MFPYAVLDDEITISYAPEHSGAGITVVFADSEKGNHLEMMIPEGEVVFCTGYSEDEAKHLITFVLQERDVIKYLAGLWDMNEPPI